MGGSESIQTSSAGILEMMKRQDSKKEELVIIGHSRGGAVAVDASRKWILSRRSPRISALILLDPVDDVDLSTIKSFSSSFSSSSISSPSFPNTIAARNPPSTAILFPPTVIISTPFGGSSRYYKNANFESICAPRGRNANSFFEVISKHSIFSAFLEYRRMGHLQMLDDLDKLSFDGACESSESNLAHMSAETETARTRAQMISQISDFVMFTNNMDDI